MQQRSTAAPQAWLSRLSLSFLGAARVTSVETSVETSA
ncbi:hypothetical protein FHS29_005582 [Saccharothrix tamanrassetensis]|uniref:Uncharacterized protein n=1 Tax=Saccharothrix tamanrassetensis TaxID=1051531 RepID=A0A841CPY4_9PSEU|nr:hypothetical protein [Saccharothrix tamanrassetensis]